MSDISLGQRIAERRKLMGLSQEAFGDKMGVSRQAISKWEADAATPEVEKLIAMSKLFGVSVGWLLGTEEDLQEDDLSTLIRRTFQSPQPEPQSTVTTPSVVAPEPANAAPVRSRLQTGFAVVAILSLLLSAVCIYLISRSPWDGISATSSTNSAKIAELESRIATLTQQLDAAKEECEIQSIILNKTIGRELTELAALIGTGTEIPETPETLPVYENIEKWSLTGQADADLSNVSVTLNSTASVDVKSAQLTIRKGNKEVLSTACAIVERRLYATARLSVADGYEYILTLNHKNGTVQQIELTGHGLADLVILTSPQLRITARKTLFFQGSPAFTQGFYNIHLEAPYLTATDAVCEWSDLKICYYHNEGLVEEVDLTAELDGLVVTAPTLSFKAAPHTYNMYYCQDGDIHNLRLEGKLIIDGVEKTFSMPLIGWVIKDNQFVKITG